MNTNKTMIILVLTLAIASIIMLEHDRIESLNIGVGGVSMTFAPQ